MDSKNGIRVHRYTSWILAGLSLATFTTGYGLARGWLLTEFVFSWVHRVFEILFITFLVLHIGITAVRFKLRWRTAIQGLRRNRGTSIHILRIAQRISSWVIVILALLMIIPGLNGYDVIAQYLEDVVPFGLHRVFDMFLAFAIIIHVAVGIKFLSIRKRWKGPSVDFFIVGLVMVLLVLPLYMEASRIPDPEPVSATGLILDPDPLDGVINTYVRIGDARYGFNSQEVETIRPEIFVRGTFSVFDILVHLSEKGLIDLEYHFDSSMNTHVIDSMNGIDNWWYELHYSGGWTEPNSFRMDMYPWKEGTNLRYHESNPYFLVLTYQYYQTEVERLNSRDGALVIPEVFVTGKTFQFALTNVTVTAHNLRPDLFQEGTITAIDLILSLGDQGLLDYELTWYDSIGDADIVGSYFVTRINDDGQAGTCGWVYETGEYAMGQTNHIHLPSDARVIVSPEFAFWLHFCV
ncbi:MAG: hypothetical protein ACXADC_07980 [Candidatus Thorarchaeota archaeon]|jgi:hypothetical protein